MVTSFEKERVEKLYPGAGELMFPPQLISKGTAELLKNADQSGDWFGQEKIDGALYMYVKGREGQSYLFGRTISKKTGVLTEKIANVPHIKKALENLVPNNSVILGEIYYPGGTSKDVTPIMGCLPKKALERQQNEYGYINYYIYDTLIYNNYRLFNLGAWDRYILTRRWGSRVDSKFIKFADAIESDLLTNTQAILDRGGEGMVFKKKDAIYVPAKRPGTYLKAKQVDYTDVVIMDLMDPTKVYEGKELEKWVYWEDEGGTKHIGNYYGQEGMTPITKPYYYGWKNAIKIGLYEDGELKPIGTVSSGLTDELKASFAESPEDYIGTVAKIQCMSRDHEEHTLRHPFFLSFHEDKNPEDCLMRLVFY